MVIQQLLILKDLLMKVAFEGGKGERGNYSLKIGSNQFIPGFEGTINWYEGPVKKELLKLHSLKTIIQKI